MRQSKEGDLLRLERYFPGLAEKREVCGSTTVRIPAGLPDSHWEKERPREVCDYYHFQFVFLFLFCFAF